MTVARAAILAGSQGILSIRTDGLRTIIVSFWEKTHALVDFLAIDDMAVAQGDGPLKFHPKDWGRSGVNVIDLRGGKSKAE